MSKVYFIPADCIASASAAARKVLEHIVEAENIELAAHIPLKLHFGEKGNRTYLPVDTYSGVNDFLDEKGIDAAYYETSVLYGGERFKAEKHLALAAKHGFDNRPVVIADGKSGEDAVQVEVKLKHFESCAVARKLAEAEQVLVLSHFKGHMLAGFGGAIKQLGMGFAAKGGKMAMHLGVKPRIISLLCRGCGACVRRCNENAIQMNGKKFRIDHEKCIGCGACFSICPHHAVSVWSISGLANALFKGKFFREKLVEYAYAGHKGKRNIYINFALNITRGCDCEPHPMRRITGDLGVFCSTDPVAVDSACIDMLKAKKVKFKGTDQLQYAESIGMGSMQYELINIAE